MCNGSQQVRTWSAVAVRAPSKSALPNGALRGSKADHVGAEGMLSQGTEGTLQEQAWLN